MFRTTKKRPNKPKTIRSSLSVEDEEDEPAVVLPSKKKKPSKRTVIIDDGVPKKKRMRTGMGFGGSLPISMEEERETIPVGVGGLGNSATANVTASSSGSYGKEALSKLKSEQTFKAEVEKKSEEPVAPQREQDATGNTSLPAYIPLDGKQGLDSPPEEPTILTGEAAMNFNQPPGAREIEEETLDDVVEETQPDSNQAEESSAWEAEVTRRAGVSQSSQTAGKTATLSTQHPRNKVSSVHLKSQVGSTLLALQEQREDLGRARTRRETEVERTKAELQLQEAQVVESGRSLEYYQHLRETLAAWVGALRELAGKVKPIQVALHELESEVAANEQWQEWENDTIAALHQAGALDHIAGRQPPAHIFDSITTVDDFGRDVKSQYAMQREKRSRHRQGIREQRQETMRGDESDAVLSDGEQEVFRERHICLQKALTVALNELDDEYVKLQNVVAVFEEWLKTNPEEYQQCFASLSLGDLASVLIQADLCALNDPWNESAGYSESKWIGIAHGATGALGQSGLIRIMEKGVLPTLVDLLDRSGYNLVSSRQTRSLSVFYGKLLKLFPPDSAIHHKLRERINRYIQEQLQSMAVPILRRLLVLPDQVTPALQEALDTATSGQMHRMQKIIRNLLIHWAPLFQKQDDFIASVLDFISTKCLYLLSSLHGLQQPQFAATPADMYATIWSALTETGWLERPEWMIQAAPLRAAAIAYNIN